MDRLLFELYAFAYSGVILFAFLGLIEVVCYDVLYVLGVFVVMNFFMKSECLVIIVVGYVIGFCIDFGDVDGVTGAFRL